jgi:hypothetical protein
MITEDYVSFETAKLLKEKGFDEECSCFYDNIIYYGTPGLKVDGRLYYKNSALDDEEYAAPTLQMAMKWLRKEHNLALSTSVTVGGWRSGVSRIKLDGEGYVVDIIDGIDGGNIPNCDTYEEACEAAIRYCLENLI